MRQHGTFAIRTLVNIATFEKLMYWSKLNQRGGQQPSGLAIGTMLSEEFGKLEVANAALLF